MTDYYETEADRVAEKEIMDAFIERSKRFARWQHIPDRYHLDDMLFDASGAVAGWGEAKCRLPKPTRVPPSKGLDFGHGGDEGYRLSLLKVIKAHELNRETDLPCWFVARFKDRSIWCLDLLTPYQLVYGGRLDRDPSQDMEPMAAFPWSAFINVVKVLT